MADRPKLSLKALSEIENERDKIFKDAEKRFDMLFFPVLAPFASLMEGIPSLRGLDKITNVPVQKKPATLLLQLDNYASALYDAEARHYVGLPDNLSQIGVWLGNLAERTNEEVRPIAADERHSLNCALQDRLNAVTEALSARAQWWLDAKRRADSKPTVSRAPRPIGAGLVVAPAAVDFIREPRSLPEPIRLEIPKQFDKLPAPALTPPKKSVREMLDDIAFNEDIKQEELALRIGLSRSVYFLAKSGKGSKRARRMIELYLSKRSAKNQD